VQLVDSAWLDQNQTNEEVRIVDSRPPVKYLSGHIPGAVNFTLLSVLDKDTLRLHSETRISESFGEAGIAPTGKVAVCDDFDGQNAAFVAWALEYLGHKSTAILSDYVESWASSGRELLYRPVKAERKSFDPKPNSELRIQASEITGNAHVKVIDLRSADEFQGKIATESRTGHLPRAINLPWTKLLGEKGKFLKDEEDLGQIFSHAGLRRDDRIVTYCSYGPRAAVGYMALRQAGYSKVRVYDGSFHEWSRRADLPVEGEGLQIEL